MTRRGFLQRKSVSFKKGLIILIERLELEFGPHDHDAALFAGPDDMH